MTTEIKEPFNYALINDEHKLAAEEIVNLCNQLGQPMIAEVIKNKFELIDRPKYDMEQSDFVKACSEIGIYCSIQGHRIDNGVEYPMVVINEDIRTFEKLFTHIKFNK
jgi:hypothetical protein